MVGNSLCQGLKLYNNSTSIEIDNSDLLELNIGNAEDIDKECCSFQGMIGRISRVSEDSIEIDMESYYLRKDFTKDRRNIGLDLRNQNNLISVSKNDILSIKNLKSEKKIKIRKALSIYGGILMVGGAVTALNALVFKKNGNQKQLLIAGGVQFSAGLILGLSSPAKKYYFKNTDNPWKFK